MVINSSSPLRAIVPPAGTPITGKSKDVFGTMFQDAVRSVENFRVDSENKVNSFLSGESDEIHEVVMSAQKAELSFELFQGVRNKVIQAYQEIMRMQL